jgi:hypothetical protein
MYFVLRLRRFKLVTDGVIVKKDKYQEFCVRERERERERANGFIGYLS